MNQLNLNENAQDEAMNLDENGEELKSPKTELVKSFRDVEEGFRKMNAEIAKLWDAASQLSLDANAQDEAMNLDENGEELESPKTELVKSFRDVDEEFCEMDAMIAKLWDAVKQHILEKHTEAVKGRRSAVIAAVKRDKFEAQEERWEVPALVRSD